MTQNPADISMETLWSQASSAYYAGEMGKAAQLGKQILQSDPNHAEALHMIGMIAKDFGQSEKALELVSQAVMINPNNGYFHHSLGLILLGQNRLDAAAERFKASLELKPDLASAITNLGSIAFRKNDYRTAVRYYQQSLQADPNQPTIHYNLGIIFQEFGQHDSALKFFQQAIDRNPNYIDAFMGRAFSQLMTQDFANGWQTYEWRWKLPHMVPRNYKQPKWDGIARPGETLFIFAEQGFGDAIQFGRYLPQLRKMGHKVIFECQKPLVKLFESSDMADEIVIGDHKNPCNPQFDRYAPLLSLPGLLNTRADTIPADTPYFSPDPSRIAFWKTELARYPGLKVGINWSGDPTAPANHGRACNLADLHPLLTQPGVSFFSLQKGMPTESIKDLPAELTLHDLDAQLTDFTETAAVLSNLDLLISTDTAVVHLAGALHRPVWTILHTSSEWRWQRERTDSPWYPSMTLFRQKLPWNWKDPVNAIAKHLSQRVTG
ncbi:MAG: glycosyltransferase family protein [Magnetococcales bacterium]|nr:glycosyltransferase family protein [Magnetococcales bacterium]